MDYLFWPFNHVIHTSKAELIIEDEIIELNDYLGELAIPFVYLQRQLFTVIIRTSHGNRNG